MRSWIWMVITSSVLLTGAQHLSVTPNGTQIKNVDSGIIFTCSLIGSRATRLPANLRWRGPNRRYINETKGRVYVERQDQYILRLYITKIQETDAGPYSCEADVSGKTLTEETRMFLYEDIRFAESPAFVEGVIGSSLLLECEATGQPEPKVSWRFNSRKITQDNFKHQFEEKGLRILNLDLRDNGTYECRAEVDSHGNLKVRPITVNVLYAPVMLRELPSSIKVIKGKQAELTCEADGNPPITYEWFKEQRMSETIRVKVKLNASGRRFVIGKVGSDDEGRYFCKVSNSLGFKETSGNLALIIPPRVGELLQKTVVEGRTVVLPCEASGFPSPNITWKTARGNLQFFNSPDQIQGDGRISADVTHAGVNKLVIQDIQRTDAGSYTCTAANEGGVDSQNVTIVVEFTPKVNITSEAVQMGWPGHKVIFTCIGYGLPVPTMTWLHDSDNIIDSDIFTVKTIRLEVVISSLEIRIPERPSALFGSYSCVAKNPHGHFMEAMHLQEAQTPDLPRNVSVLEETPHWVKVAAEAPRRIGGMPVRKWKIIYEQHSLNDSEPVQLIFDDNRNLTVGDLKPGATYTFYLSAGNAVGFGKPVKFRVRTPRRMHFKEQADVPKHWGENENQTLSSDPEGKKPEVGVDMIQVNPEEGNSVDGSPFTSETSFSGFLLAMTVGVAVVFAAIVLAVVGFACSRGRQETTGRSSAGKGAKDFDEKIIDELGLVPIQPTAIFNGGALHGKPGSSTLSRKNSLICYASPTPHRACALPSNSPHPGLTAVGSVGGVGDSIQRLAWETMMITTQGVIERLPEPVDGDRPLSISELPPPPLFLLDTSYCAREGGGGEGRGEGGGEGGSGGTVSGEGYRSGDSVDDDIDEIDYTIRAPSFSSQLQPYP